MPDNTSAQLKPVLDFTLKAMGVKNPASATEAQRVQAGKIMTEAAAFKSQYGIIDAQESKSDLKGNKRYTFGIDDGTLITAMATRGEDGKFGNNKLPANINSALNYAVQNYGKTVTTPPAGLKPISSDIDKKLYGTSEPNMFASVVDENGAGTSGTLWQKNADGTYTNKGVSYYDSKTIRSSGLGAVAGLVAAVASGGMLAPALGITSAAGIGALSGAVGGLVSSGSLEGALKGGLLGAAGGFASDAIGLTGGAGSGGLDASMLDPANLGQFTNTAGLPTELTAHLGETIPGTSSTFAQALQAGAWSPDLTKVFSEVANVPLEQASQVEQAAQSGFQLDQNMLDATNPANLPAVPTDPALQPGSIPSIGTAGTLTGTAGGGMLDNIVSGAKDLVGGGSNLNSLVNAGTGLLGGYLNRNAEVDATEAQAKAQAEARAASEAYAAKIDATQQERLKLQNEKLAVANSGMGEADKQLMLSQIAAKEQSMMNDITTGGMAAQYDADARRKQAASLSAAGASAAAMAQFTPYGIKNNFGSSDTAGNTTLDPRFQSQFDQLYGQSQTALNQAGNVFGQTAPMAGASQSMFQLGQGYLATSPQAQAQKYMDEQMALYGAADERSLAALESKLSSRGRLGFAAGGTTTGMNAANPEMEAYYNAQKQRDLQLAANATQGGQQYAQFGVNMMGAGAKNLQDMYATQSAAYNPYNTAMAGMTGLQGEVQKNAAFGADLGQRRAQAGANAGQLMLSGATQAAQVQYQADQNAAQYAAYQEAQRAALAAMTPLERARAEAQAGYNSAGRTYDTANSQAADLSKSAANIPAASYVINAAPTAPANSPAGNMLTGVANQNYGWYGTGP